MAIDALRTTQNPYTQYDGGASVMNNVINRYPTQQQVAPVQNFGYNGGQNVMQNIIGNVGSAGSNNFVGNSLFGNNNALTNPTYGSIQSSNQQRFDPWDQFTTGLSNATSGINWGDVAKIAGNIVMYAAL